MGLWVLLLALGVGPDWRSQSRTARLPDLEAPSIFTRKPYDMIPLGINHSGRLGLLCLVPVDVGSQSRLTPFLYHYVLLSGSEYHTSSDRCPGISASTGFNSSSVLHSDSP